MPNYDSLPGFEHVYLEDSYVLAILASLAYLRFDMDVVLCPGHPAYSAPRDGEQYCYRNGRLEFEGIQSVEWIELRIRPSIDASGDVDFGNIDLFTHESGRFELTGDWGSVRIVSQIPRLVLSQAKPS